MWRTNAVTLAQNKTYKVKMKFPDADESSYEVETEMGFFDATQKFSPNSDQSVYSLVRLMRFYFAISLADYKFSISYRNSSGVTQYWDMSSAWGATSTLSSTFTSNVEYTFIFITTPTQMKVQVKSSDETTTYIDTAYFDLSSMATPANSVWFAIGDFRTNNYKGKMLINSYSEV